MVEFTFVTYSGLPALDPDDRLAADELSRRGSRVGIAVWDDPGVDWNHAGVCVLRSTWDYHRKYNEFVRWLDQRADALCNPATLVRWNLDKRYMLELTRAGVPIVPTVVADGVAGDSVARAAAERGWREVVVKPVVGLATWNVRRLKPGELHHDVAAETPQLVQQYLPSVEDYGERALIFFGSEFSHAVRKTAFQELLPAGEAGETPAQATADEISVATAAIAALPQMPAYARVDVVRDLDNKPVILEVELVEPSLFLSMDAEAPRRFADALCAFRDAVTRS